MTFWRKNGYFVIFVLGSTILTNCGVFSADLHTTSRVSAKDSATLVVRRNPQRKSAQVESAMNELFETQYLSQAFLYVFVTPNRLA